MILVIYAICLLVAAILVGMRWRLAGFWVYTDVIYYPLAMLGIIVFFFETTVARETADTIDLISIKREEYANIKSSAPAVRDVPYGVEGIHSAGGLLGTISRLGEACKGAYSLTAQPNCLVAMNLGEVTQGFEKRFSEYRDATDLSDLCDDYPRLLAELRKKGGGFIVREFEESYVEGLEKGYTEFEYEKVRTFQEETEARIKGQMAAAVQAVVSDKGEQQTLEAYLLNEVETLGIVAKSYGVCLHAPRAVRDGTLRKWSQTLAKKGDEVSELQNKLSALVVDAKGPNPAERFRLLFWPYLIIGGLALKFAKGIAGVAQRVKPVSTA